MCGSFFEDNEMWLARVLGEGRSSKVIEFEGSATSAARCFYAALHGAMLSAHTFGDPARLLSVGRWLFDSLLPRRWMRCWARQRGEHRLHFDAVVAMPCQVLCYKS